MSVKAVVSNNTGSIQKCQLIQVPRLIDSRKERQTLQWRPLPAPPTANNTNSSVVSSRDAFCARIAPMRQTVATLTIADSLLLPHNSQRALCNNTMGHQFVQTIKRQFFIRNSRINQRPMFNSNYRLKFSSRKVSRNCNRRKLRTAVVLSTTLHRQV